MSEIRDEGVSMKDWWGMRRWGIARAKLSSSGLAGTRIRSRAYSRERSQNRCGYREGFQLAPLCDSQRVWRFRELLCGQRQRPLTQNRRRVQHRPRAERDERWITINLISRANANAARCRRWWSDDPTKWFCIYHFELPFYPIRFFSLVIQFWGNFFTSTYVFVPRVAYLRRNVQIYIYRINLKL